MVKKPKTWEEAHIMEQAKFYYFRDEMSRPVITKCRLETDVGTGIGFAICSPMDMPCKRVGRGIARQRAVHAVKTKGNSGPINREHVFNLLYSICDDLSNFQKGKSVFETDG